MSRKHARAWVMKALYAMEIQKEYTEDFVDYFLESQEVKSRDMGYLKEVLSYFIKNQEQVDQTIKDEIDWDFDFLNRLDLSIMRLAIVEIQAKIVPMSIAINEAVELAKEYSTEKSYRFINGVLASVAEKEEKDDKTT